METTHRLPRFFVLWSTLIWILMPLGTLPATWLIPTQKLLISPDSFFASLLVAGVVGIGADFVAVALRTFLQGALYRQAGLRFVQRTWLVQTLKGYLIGEILLGTVIAVLLSGALILNNLFWSSSYWSAFIVVPLHSVVRAVIVSFIDGYMRGRMQAAVLRDAGHPELAAVWLDVNVRGSLAAAAVRAVLRMPRQLWQLGRGLSSLPGSLDPPPSWLFAIGRLGLAMPAWLYGAFTIIGYLAAGIPGVTTGLAVKRYLESQSSAASGVEG